MALGNQIHSERLQPPDSKWFEKCVSKRLTTDKGLTAASSVQRMVREGNPLPKLVDLIYPTYEGHLA